MSKESRKDLNKMSTMTLSESMMVWRRWAIVNTVQFLNFSRMVAWISISVLKQKHNKKPDRLPRKEGGGRWGGGEGGCAVFILIQYAKI